MTIPKKTPITHRIEILVPVASMISGAMLALTLWIFSPDEKIGFHWIVITVTCLFIVVISAGIIIYNLREIVKNLESQMRDGYTDLIPVVQSYAEIPKLKLIVSRSPLFIENIDVTVFLRGEVHCDSETILCYGKIAYLHTNPSLMEVIINSDLLEIEAKQRIKSILKNWNYYPRLRVIPGAIKEQEL